MLRSSALLAWMLIVTLGVAANAAQGIEVDRLISMRLGSDVDVKGKKDLMIGSPCSAAHAGVVGMFSAEQRRCLWKVTGRRLQDRLGSEVDCGVDIDGDAVGDCLASTGVNSPTPTGQPATAAGLHNYTLLISGKTGEVIRKHAREDDPYYGCFSAFIGDANGDAQSDYYVASSRGRIDIVSGTGAVLSTGIHEDRSGSTRYYILADIDGDGCREIAMCQMYGAAADKSEILLLSGKTLTTLQAIPTPTTVPRVLPVLDSVQDCNGDGVHDLMVSTASYSGRVPGRVEILSAKDYSRILKIEAEAFRPEMVGFTGNAAFGMSVIALPSGAGVATRLVVGCPASKCAPPEAKDAEKAQPSLPLYLSGITAGGFKVYSVPGGQLERTVHGRTDEDRVDASFGSALCVWDDLDGDGVTDFVVATGIYPGGCQDMSTDYLRVYSPATFGVIREFGLKAALGP